MKRLIYLLLGFTLIFSLTSCNNSYIKPKEEIILLRKNAISNNGSSLNVKATIKPSYAINKKVSWSLAWNPSYDFSSWAFGAPDITKYIKLTPSSDTLTCSVKVTPGYKLPTYAILTCTSQANSMIKATCRIDYLSRYYHPYVDMADAPDAIENDLSFKGFGDVCLKRIDSLKTSIGSSMGSLSGDIKNIRIDYQSEWETGMGWCFYIENYQNPICEDESYEYIIADEELYVPILYDVYYGNTLIQANCSGNLVACLV